MKAIFAAALFAQATGALNILMNNDDGFGVSNIRELYRLLVEAGHHVVMVAPATDQSGQGGRMSIDTSPTLSKATPYGIVPAGSPSLGRDPHDGNIWYYNGTPATCTMVALDYVLPRFFPNMSTPDLFVAGPNFGNNVGTFAFTGSGTIGSTYTAIQRNIPGIAFSAANPTSSYLEVNSTNHPATLAAVQAVKFVNKLAKNTPAGKPLLPLGYGINVNIPNLNSTCSSPRLVQTRFSGKSGMPKLAFNETSGLVGLAGSPSNYLGYVTEGANQCINGDCKLVGESVAVLECETAVTIFTVDYTAPVNDKTDGVVKAVFGGSTSCQPRKQ
ncbi:uncharacterized protein E0L32_007635 [Thyridium curvatum]|uniref:Survival protein SurE-like phosphatase/nucleotidase domain-containing protein n=1 Tax=Thyridium curvatum TaxID=1093900 RepID=A0A507AY21_9PEZI|nr:uncharacterized protein E0L32_007635 [Thyridium curvatum]TPX11656.1 hypothetical protein E0L32_007635 [Thyridium curvatum]